MILVVLQDTSVRKLIRIVILKKMDVNLLISTCMY